MKVLVAIKRVIDPYTKVRIKADESGVETGNVKMTINPFCEIAVEEAIRLKESGVASEVVVVSIGSTVCQEQLRSALALGADRAIHLETEKTCQPLVVAKLLKAVALQEEAQLILLGKQSIDNDNNQVAQMLAALMACPQATFASNIQIENDKAMVTREIDGGLETLQISLPAVVSTDLRLNEPRYASLPNIMRAKKKPLDVVDAESLGVEIKSSQQTLQVFAPPNREAGVMVASVTELVDKLKNEAKVID
ncbi:electron transfer flavoprotein subunit beta/FixA family protein [Vibrio europaeus]|uniref:Electron transfer flavoprotein subunit beta n=1 Tax=Vibrio europaeus TaxID=300876 RepID=A0A178J5J8_9VIBR|nr:electron transfer flavoprotein subunit beta/FixA family protein [Vibrio europaeus]MDC5706248.1 electron transfer flavoprotein subunit beta/FixA family protein [Vibrio europaeus]MDC5709658.1 electron transfer flavoprotein subunit beta/FixA family protein [Vibrio europaeus]MDC5714057.1 electron transfer flavoprotein subunit beta/FixA family protein [Vibrio europaeus]MDC5720796.1 electron transfer flavoprotein subunit beta/FixA family protein [Vibrio europaeus]MDC5723334.1 electron transfer fl